MQPSSPLDKTADQALTQPDHDPENPVSDPHESHAWILSSRFAECATCAARDHWPAARRPCPGADAPKRGYLTLAEAIRLLYLDLDAFAVWWNTRAADLGLSRPSLDEWAAEFSEWRIKRP